MAMIPDTDGADMPYVSCPVDQRPRHARADISN
jgi:hypothetical protein